MRRALSVLVLLALPFARSDAAEPRWLALALPPDAERLNREADREADAAGAVRRYAQSLRLCPSNGPALYGLGRALFALNRMAESRVVFRRLNALFPGEPVALEALAGAAARLPAPRRADVREGLAAAEEAVRLQPEAPEAWHVLSVLRHRDGDYAGAAEAARQAVARDARNPSDPETTALYQQQEIACNDALSVFSPLD